jgi:hypothetical protein
MESVIVEKKASAPSREWILDADDGAGAAVLLHKSEYFNNSTFIKKLLFPVNGTRQMKSLPL